MKYAQIVNGEVYAVYEYEVLPEFASNILMILLPENSEVGVGYLWNGEDFSSPLPTEPIVPSEVTMRQAKLALLRAGLYEQVEQGIGTLPSPQKEEAAIEWYYSSVMRRDKPFVSILGASLNLTEQQIDQLFQVAASIE